MTSSSSASRKPRPASVPRDDGTGPGVDARPLRVRCLVRTQHAHVRPVEEFLGDRARFTYDADWDPAALVNARPDIVVCINDWPFRVARCLDAARDAGIPSLVLQDGILEWRCQYRNPLFGAGGGAPQHQPVIADRIACIGAQSARQIAAWGNARKVEVTGMPRLDPLLARSPAPPRRPGSRVLVMTAKNPGFDEDQRATTLRSLESLKAALSRIAGVEVAWRISRGLVPELGIENRLVTLGGEDLLDQIEWADAVVTTPSTVMLESMLLDRPVAALDFHNVPRFVPTAWTISAPEHIDSVVREILDPPASKMAFQRDCLSDCLRCDGPAAPRVARLIERIVANGVSAPSRPDRAEREDRRSREGARSRVPPALGDLYPEHPAFAETSPSALQARLARAQKEIERLNRELSRRSVAGRLHSLVLSLAKRLRRRS